MLPFRSFARSTDTLSCILRYRCTPWSTLPSAPFSSLPAQRYSSTIKITPPPDTHQSSPRTSSSPELSTSPPPPPPRSRRARPYIYAAIFLTLGISVGTLIRWSFVPPPPFSRNTTNDTLLLARIFKASEALPITQSLRASPNVREWEAYSSFSPEEKEHRLSSGPMGGSAGIALQRVFWLEDDKKAVSLLWFGRGMAGWPGVVHGGALATVMDESLGRVALRLFPSKTGVTANLELQYRSKTLVDEFYVLRVEAVPGEVSDRKAKIKGTLESLDGKVCVEATALFVVPKGFKLKEINEGF